MPVSTVRVCPSAPPSHQSPVTDAFLRRRPPKKGGFSRSAGQIYGNEPDRAGYYNAVTTEQLLNCGKTDIRMGSHQGCPGLTHETICIGTLSPTRAIASQMGADIWNSSHVALSLPKGLRTLSSAWYRVREHACGLDSRLFGPPRRRQSYSSLRRDCPVSPTPCIDEENKLGNNLIDRPNRANNVLLSRYTSAGFYII